MTKEKRDLLVFGYGLAAIILFFNWRISVKHGWGLTNNILSVATLIMLYVSVGNRALLKKFYDKWMIGAGFIGHILSTIILSLLFYCIFAPVGIVLRIIRKDLLHRKIQLSQESYWDTKEEHIKDNTKYQHQF